MKTLQSLHDILAEELKLMYAIEKHIQENFHSIQAKVSLPPLVKVISRYVDKSTDRIAKLQWALEYSSVKSAKVHVPVIEALFQEANNSLSQGATENISDLVAIRPVQLIIHYKYLTYKSITNLAHSLRFHQAESILTELTEWERETSEHLTRIAEEEVNNELVTEKLKGIQ